MELLDICNEEGFPTGETVSREIAHRDGILHRTAHVWVVRKKDTGYDILLQKRSMEKDSFPGLYDTSSAGHIPAGEESLPSALRELAEELGIIAQPQELSYAGMFRIQYDKNFHGKRFRDNEVARVYVYQKPVEIEDLTLQASEVEEVRWFDLEEVYREIQTCRNRFCVPSVGMQVLRDYLAGGLGLGTNLALFEKIHCLAE
ncbi:MAG: NUDIX domain-containing protein [Lachnospiraceae bacterium]|nr:NUDIX domain-containing protein [Lachnospiraceae bacterium]